MAIYTVSTITELNQYVKAAVDGDTILVNPGIYSGASFSSIVKSGNVTIASADPDNLAQFTGLNVTKSQGLTFSNLDFFVDRDGAYSISSSSRIVLDKIDVHGTVNGSSADDYKGLMIRDSSFVTIQDSYLHELTSGIGHINSSNISITRNRFQLIRNDAIGGGGTSNITIADNVFSDMDHIGDIHPDAIQFWTSNANTAGTNINILRNVFNRGSGELVQGIFMTDEVGGMAYTNVTVADNVIVGAVYNGILLAGTEDLTMTGNVVIGQTDQLSWLGGRGVANIKAYDNIVNSLANTGTTISAAGNVLATELSMTGGATLSAWLETNAVAGQLHGVTASFRQQLLSQIELKGFIDGASPTGASYEFDPTDVYGTAAADRLSAGVVGVFNLFGYDGADSLTGSRNGLKATLRGGKANDTYNIYQTIDEVSENAGEGTDTINAYANYSLPYAVETIRAMAANLTVSGNGYDNTLVAHAQGSTLVAWGGNDVLQGGTGNDRLYGGDGIDRVTCSDGNDYADGGNGDDSITGGIGKDTILGGAGNDTIEGGKDADVLAGGTGADCFVYREGDFGTNVMAWMDRITDFKASELDKISLNSVDANELITGNQAFTFVGTRDFSGVAGQLRYVADVDGITVYGDTDGDLVADLAIDVLGLTSIVASNFTL